jgi:PAS domain S-box-containing protein
VSAELHPVPTGGPATVDIVDIAFEASPDGILVVAPDGRILARNRRFAEVWGFADDELAGDDALALQAAAARVVDGEGFITRVRELYAARVEGRDELLLRDGRLLDRTGVPLRDQAGAYVGFAWFFRDITSQRNAEQELRELARTLQAMLLPPRTPAIPGMEVAVRYRPADHQLGVGGDFFDVFRTGRTEWGVVIGDVCGKGPTAASLAALVRHTTKSAAAHYALPSDVLGEVNETLLAEQDLGERFCSVAFARLELDVCGAWLTLSCGGHPRPIVVRAAGWVDQRGQPGMLLGLFDQPELADDRVGLGPGDALVFCTDGITEARGADGELFGDERLAEVLLDHCGDAADAIAGAVVAEALAFQGGRVRDDVAVLVVRVPMEAKDDPVGRLERAAGTVYEKLRLPDYPIGDDTAGLRTKRPRPPREARIVLPPKPESATRARTFVAGVLHSWRMSEMVGGDAELLTSELATNAVRHARTSFVVVVRYDGASVRIEVGDGSRALPVRRAPASDDTGGRGYVLVDALAADWGVLETVTGKRIWVDLPVPPEQHDT